MAEVHALDDYYLAITLLITIAYQLFFFSIAFSLKFDKLTGTSSSSIKSCERARANLLSQTSPEGQISSSLPSSPSRSQATTMLARLSPRFL